MTEHDDICERLRALAQGLSPGADEETILAAARVIEALRLHISALVGRCASAEAAAASLPALQAALERANRAALEELKELRETAAFYKRRCDALQAWQSSMRDPERTVVCDILANGFTLDQTEAGDRYGGLRPNARVQPP